MLDYDLDLGKDECLFKIHELRDSENDKKVTIGGHECKDFGLNVQLYLRKADYEKIEKKFRNVDQTTGKVLGNQELSCKIGKNDLFVMCRYYLGPDNNRIGFLS